MRCTYNKPFSSKLLTLQGNGTHSDASFVMLYHIPDLEPNRRQKICPVAKGLRSRSTSRGSLQEEWINEDPGPSRGTDEVERSDSDVWRIPFEPKDAQEDDNLNCTTKDPLGRLIIGITQSFNALRLKTGGAGVPEIPIEEVCRQFADKVDLDTKNEEEVIQKTDEAGRK